MELVISWDITVGVGGETESCVAADVRLPVNCTFLFFSLFFSFSFVPWLIY